MSTAVLELTDVSKDFRGLRPLRIERLRVSAGECVAIQGVDLAMAEVFVNLTTGATLPDRGEVRVFGRPTSSIADSADWLTLLDRFGIVSDRAVLLDGLTPLQNLAVPFTLEIEPLAEAALSRVRGLAHEAGLIPTDLDKPVATLDAAARARVRLGRALALDPELILLEHPSAAVDRPGSVALARHVREVARNRSIALVALTADCAFAAEVADRIVTLDARSGRLKESRNGWGFGRWLG